MGLETPCRIVGLSYVTEFAITRIIETVHFPNLSLHLNPSSPASTAETEDLLEPLQQAVLSFVGVLPRAVVDQEAVAGGAVEPLALVVRHVLPHPV